MIDKKTVENIVNEWLGSTEYFLVDLSVSADDRIVVVIDHAEGVWIEDCAELSRYIESKLDREEEDYELEVGSAGLGQPFQVHQQYVIHVGHPVEVQLRDGHKLRGTLTEVTDSNFTVTVEEKVKHEGEKRPHMEQVPHTLTYAEVATTKYLIQK